MRRLALAIVCFVAACGSDGGGDPCPYRDDGICDEPDYCPAGTDGADCCEWANDGVCDEPGNCAPGTDGHDCECQWRNDGYCDEPNLCPPGSDPEDCMAPTCQDAGQSCAQSYECCGALQCIGGTCGTCSADYPNYCAEYGGTCWTPGMVCSTATECSDGTLHGCSLDSLTYSCSDGQCHCPAGYPVYCGPSGSFGAGCWTAGTDCSTRTQCPDGTQHSCHVGSTYSCSSSSCYCDNPSFDYCSSAGTCVDLLNDPNNCGACGATCPSGYTCQNGTTCVTGTGCAAGLTYCPGYGCVDLDTDWGNCGFCGNSCSSPPYCSEFGCISCYYECQFGSCEQIMCSG